MRSSSSSSSGTGGSPLVAETKSSSSPPHRVVAADVELFRPLKESGPGRHERGWRPATLVVAPTLVVHVGRLSLVEAAETVLQLAVDVGIADLRCHPVGVRHALWVTSQPRDDLVVAVPFLQSETLFHFHRFLLLANLCGCSISSHHPSPFSSESRHPSSTKLCHLPFSLEFVGESIVHCNTSLLHGGNFFALVYLLELFVQVVFGAWANLREVAL